MRIARNLKLAVAILTVIYLAPSAFAQQATPPTPEEARKFIEDAEKRLFELSNNAQRASWVQENFITEDTEQISADANEILNSAATAAARTAHRTTT